MARLIVQDLLQRLGNLLLVCSLAAYSQLPQNRLQKEGLELGKHLLAGVVVNWLMTVHHSCAQQLIRLLPQIVSKTRIIQDRRRFCRFAVVEEATAGRLYQIGSNTAVDVCCCSLQ